MTVVLTPDSEYRGGVHPLVSVFLAGTIDLGNSVDWQKDAIERLDVPLIFNPRRDTFEGLPESSNPDFVDQVEWELSALEFADIIAMNFTPGSVSPISLLEFGMYAKTGKLIVCCPDTYSRHGNVQAVANRYNIALTSDFDEWIDLIMARSKTFLR